MQHYKRATSGIHKHLVRLQHGAIKAGLIMGFALSPVGEIVLDAREKEEKKVVDKMSLLHYPLPSMNVTTTATLKCKHCDKTFPTQAALQVHHKKVEAGKQGGYRKHRASHRYAVLEQPLDTHRTNGTTALDKLAEIRARKEQLLDAMTQTLADEQAAMEAVQREYEEQVKKVTALSTELTVDRKVRIALREELEAHKGPES